MCDITNIRFAIVSLLLRIFVLLPIPSKAPVPSVKTFHFMPKSVKAGGRCILCTNLHDFAITEGYRLLSVEGSSLSH